ncbi:MAG: TadE/TadG family type IV pilus assembly protein [Bacillota bacterium]
MSNIIEGFWKDQRGFSLFMVGMGIMALFGMAALVTDFGRIALVRQRLVNAVDSATLAAARDLALISDPYTREMTARQRAVDIASANGAPSRGITVNISNTRISVDAEDTVDLIMSRAFGVNQRTVRAHAAAQVGSITSYRGVTPLTIREQPLIYGQLVTLKYGSPDSPGNFGALALSGRGSRNYKHNLINGFSEIVKLGDIIDTEPGNMNGPTDGIDERLDRCTSGCTFDSFEPNCPKILVLPTHTNDLQGRDQIQVSGFATFFVDREATSSADDEIKGYFVRMAAEGDPDFVKPVTSLYGAKLVE